MFGVVFVVLATYRTRVWVRVRVLLVTNDNDNKLAQAIYEFMYNI